MRPGDIHGYSLQERSRSLLRVLLWALAILPLQSACTTDRPDPDTRHEQIALEYIRGVYVGDPSVVDRLASPDIVVSYPVFDQIFGKTAIRGRQAARDFATGFHERWVDSKFTVHQIVTEGDTVVLVWTFRARRSGADDADGDSTQESAWGGITLLRFNDQDQVAFEIGEESTPGPVGRVPSAFREQQIP